MKLTQFLWYTDNCRCQISLRKNYKKARSFLLKCFWSLQFLLPGKDRQTVKLIKTNQMKQWRILFLAILTFMPTRKNDWKKTEFRPKKQNYSCLISILKSLDSTSELAKCIEKTFPRRAVRDIICSISVSSPSHVLKYSWFLQ